MKMSRATRASGRGAMANDDMTVGQPTSNWPELKSSPLVAGGILIGIGAVIALAGAAVAGSHVFGAIRAWWDVQETPPDQLARMKWEQAKSAAAAGAANWQGHPNAKVRMARRTTVTTG